MVQTLNVDAIKKAWDGYFLLYGVEQVAHGEEAKAQAVAKGLRTDADSVRDKAIAAAQKAFSTKKEQAEEKHAESLGLIDETVQLARTASQEAAKATKDHQDKAEEELGMRPDIPQAATQMRRTGI